MSSKTRFLLLLAVLVGLLVLPVAAEASGQGVRRDCIADGELDGSYSVAELRDALSDAPSNEDEYGGDCRTLIENELQQQVAGRRASGGNGGGGSSPPAGEGNPDGTGFDEYPDRPDDELALADALESADSSRSGRPPSLEVGGAPIVPDVPPAALASVTSTPNEVPLPVLLALLSLAVLGAGAAALVIRRRFPDARRVAQRIRHR